MHCLFMPVLQTRSRVLNPGQCKQRAKHPCCPMSLSPASRRDRTYLQKMLMPTQTPNSLGRSELWTDTAILQLNDAHL